VFIRPFLLQVVVDDVEQAAPEGALAIHPVGRLAEHVGLEREPVRPALDHAPHDTRLLQNLHVLGDGGLGHPETSGGVTDCCRAPGEALDDPAANRMRERPERIVNHRVNGTTHTAARRPRPWSPVQYSYLSPVVCGGQYRSKER
jgi:hypothetical protein